MSKIETEVSEENNNGCKYSIKYIKGGSIGANNRHGISTWVNRDGSITTQSYHMGKLHGKTVVSGIDIYYYLYGNQVTEEEFRRYELIEKLAGIGNEDE